jgi:hypothetical protein
VYPDASGATIGEHVGGVPGDACIDAAAKQLVHEHHRLHAQLTRGHHHYQLRPLQECQASTSKSGVYIDRPHRCPPHDPCSWIGATRCHAYKKFCGQDIVCMMPWEQRSCTADLDIHFTNWTTGLKVAWNDYYNAVQGK